MPPPTVAQLFEHAERLARMGDLQGARAGFVKVVERAPSVADGMLRLSQVETMLGHYCSARDWALRAARAPKRSVGAELALLQRLRAFNALPLLHETITRHLANAATPGTVLAECALQAINANDHALALRCAEAVAAKAPDDLRARTARGLVLAQHGRIDDAEADYQWVLARQPKAALIWLALAGLRTQTPQSSHVDSLRDLIAMPGLPPIDMAAARFALHKELDDLGDHEGAWQALEAAMRIRRGALQYDPGAICRLVDALVAWPVIDAPNPGPPHGPTPVFIVGMHRSGTTLLEQLLAATPRVMPCGELYDFPDAMRNATDHHCEDACDAALVARARGIDFDAVGRRYLDGIAWRLEAQTHFTDKLPANFLNLGFICRALPQVRILHMVRDPVATCFSNLRELYMGINRHSYVQSEMAGWFLQYRRLMAHWRTALPGRILDVDYARLTADPAGTMREVAAFCGLDYMDGMRSTATSGRAVSTASVVQVRGEVARRDTPKWWPYARQLQPLMTALREGGVDVPEPGTPG